MKKWLSAISGAGRNLSGRLHKAGIKNSYGGRKSASPQVTPMADSKTESFVRPGRKSSAVKKTAPKPAFKLNAAALLKSVVSDKKKLYPVIGIAAAAILTPIIVVSALSGNKSTAYAIKNAQNVPEVAPYTAYTEDTQATATTAPSKASLVEWMEDSVQTTAVGAPEQPEENTSNYLALEPESNHPDVIKLQERLMELYYMDNDEPTEYYGPITQQAVKFFQRKHSLPIDGVAGVKTQELLFSDAAMPYTVTVGADGPDVEGIQERLKELGYGVGVTGYFGSDTEYHVRYFQRMNGLTDDGSVGKETKELLFSEDAEPAEPSKKKTTKKTTSSSSTSSSSSSKKKGSSTSHTANPGDVESFIAAAMQYEGSPYVRGGKGPDNFDCSGFVYYALKQSGNGIGYMTSGGWAGSGYPTVYSMSDMQRGDVICFNGHVGIYLGGGQMIDASSSLGKVVVRNCTGSWAQRNFISAKRPL